MKPWRWMMLCLGCLALAGCRANSYRTMLEQESRQWEDRYYVVKDRLDECQAVLESTRQKNLELEQASGCPGSVKGSGSSGLRDALIFPGLMGKSSGGKASGTGRPSGPLTPPSIEGFSSDRFQKIEPDTPTAEEIRPGDPQKPNALPVDPDSVAPPFMPTAPKQSLAPPAGASSESYRDGGPGSEAPPFKQPAPSKPLKHCEPRKLQDPVLPPDTKIKLPGDQSTPKPQAKRSMNLSGDSSQVARIELIGLPSDGYNLDGRPGDDGVQFVLQPRDQNGKTLDAAGPISIVIVDPLPAGKSTRLARWDLTPGQAAGYYDRSPQGFHLRLPWPASTPKHSRLRLFARYTTADGRKVQAEKAISVALATDKTPNWGIDPPPQLSQSTATQQSPVTPHSTLTIQSPPAVTPQPQQRPRVAAQTRQAKPPKAPPRRKRPVWSPDRP